MTNGVSFWSATNDRKNILIESFRNFQIINTAKNISVFTECYALKDFKILENTSAMATRFWSKILFIQNCTKITFFDKIPVIN